MITRVLLSVSLPLMLGQGDWVAHKGSGFTVSFPGKPAEHKQNVKAHTGPVDVIVLVYETPKGDAQFVVSYSDYPDAAVKPGTEDRRLDNARDGAVMSVKGKLKEEKKIALNGHPGRDLSITAEKTVRTRIYTVKNRLYQLAVVGPPAVVAAKDTEKFFDSFKLVK